MLTVLLFQAAVAAAPVQVQAQAQAQAQTPAPPVATPPIQTLLAGRRCRSELIQAMSPFFGGEAPPSLQDSASLYDRARPVGPQPPIWRPDEFPEAGYYAAVDVRVNNCPVPTPIHLPNAPRPSGARD